MDALLDLKNLFVATGLSALIFFLMAVVPPDYTQLTTGWDLSADGQFVLKCAGFAMLTQAYYAWIFRNERHVGIAKGLALTQLAIGNLNWTMYLALRDEGIFATGLQVQAMIIFTTFMHNALGILLLASVVRANRRAAIES